MFRNKKWTLIIGIALLIAALLSFNIFLNSIYRLPILMYHSIDYTAEKNTKTTISPEVFARQMKYLHDKEYNVITPEKAVQYIRDNKTPPAKTVAITIDDGYEIVISMLILY